MSALTEQPNKNYMQAFPYMRLIDDCVVGEPALKYGQNQKHYLPSPCCPDEDAEVAERRYNRYLKSAEFDGVPSVTLEALLGALSHQPNNYDGIPEGMDYIIDDADGDGLSLDEHIKIAQAELLKMRFCGLLAEYSDLAGMGIGDEQLTRAQVKQLGLRSSIKYYSRKSILDWNFRRINGVKQLSYVLLSENETRERDGDEGGLVLEDVKSYLILALDEDGNYYQKKRIETETGWTERFYPETPNGMFNFIPFEFAIQGSYPKGVLPDELGYLLPVCTKSIYRYNMYAAMKESMHFTAAPITWSAGWTEQGFKLFKDMNGGRDYLSVEAGSHWTLPEGATTGVIETSGDNSPYFTYLDRNAKEIKALGGAFDTDMQDSEQTATATLVNAAERLSVLSSLQSGLEWSYARVICYCAMFEGIDQDIELKLNREFTSVKLSPQERQQITNEYMQGVISHNEALRQLEKGGVLTVEAEQLLQEIELNGQ